MISLQAQTWEFQRARQRRLPQNIFGRRFLVQIVQITFGFCPSAILSAAGEWWGWVRGGGVDSSSCISSGVTSDTYLSLSPDTPNTQKLIFLA